MHGSVCLCTMWQRQAAFPDQSSAGVYYRKGEKLQQSPDLLLAVGIAQESRAGGGDRNGSRNLLVGKRHFLRCHLYIKCIILPRQARDKHRENSKKEWRFLRAQGLMAWIEKQDGTYTVPCARAQKNVSFFFVRFVFLLLLLETQSEC
jgi:hypothetical protein